MIGFISRMYSPSIVHIRRSTQSVAGWCGPRLIVKGSFSASSCVPNASSGMSRSSLTPARQLVHVEGDQDGLTAHREVAPLGVPRGVIGHEHPGHVGVAVEDD